MQKSHVIRYFGGRQQDVVNSTRASKATVSLWGDVIPKVTALELHYLTDGRSRNGVTLVYDPKFYPGSMTREELALGPDE